MPSQQNEWFKSSYSGQNGECLEARRAADRIDLRDSTRPGEAVLTVTARAWAAFLAASVTP
jgi:hypothetical protein